MGKFDLTPEEAQSLGDKFSVTPGESAKKHAYPPSKSETMDDLSLGLMSGMADSSVPGANQAIGDNPRGAGDAFSPQPELSPVERKLRQPYEGDVAFLKEAAPFAAGAGLGMGAKFLLGRLALAPAGSAASQAAKVATSGIENSFAHGGAMGTSAKVLQTLFPWLAPAVAGGARAGVAGTAQGLPVAGAGVASGAGHQGETAEQRAARVLLGLSPFQGGE